MELSLNVNENTYKDCVSQLSEFGKQTPQWLICKQGRQGIEWIVMDKPRWIVRLFYYLMGWNPGVEKVLATVANFFESHQNQPYAFSEESLTALSSLLNLHCRNRDLRPRLQKIYEGIDLVLKRAVFEKEMVEKSQKTLEDLQQKKKVLIEEINSLSTSITNTNEILSDLTSQMKGLESLFAEGENNDQ